MKLKRIILTALLLEAVIATTACDNNAASTTSQEESSIEPIESSTTGKTSASTITVIKYDYDFHTDDQSGFLQLDNPNLFTLYAKAKEEKSAPNALHFELDNVGDTDIVNVYRVSDNKLIYSTTGSSIDIYNLEINTEYTIKALEQTKLSFKTPDTGLGLRNLYIDGVVNARDIGGWHDASGNMLKQGLIYRSARLSEDETGVTTITDAGIDTMLNTLGIKSEIDLRTSDDSGGISVSPLGEAVTYFAVPMKSGGNIITLNADKIKEFFHILGDENNYPVVMHCSIGTDRTGCMACILEALLGVSKNDILRDYLFSNFSNISRMRTSSTIDDYLELFETKSGTALAEKTYNYLIDIGVAKDDLDTVIRLMK